MRYVAIKNPPRIEDEDYSSWGTNDRSIEVYPTDDQPIPTGLFDAAGIPLFRIRERIRMGFCRE